MNDITMRREINWLSSSKTDVGCSRDINEDCIFDDSSLGLWAIADGMGGYEAGEIASKMVVDALSEVKNENSFALFIDSLEDNIIEVNKAIKEYSDVLCNHKTMGSTIVTLAIRGKLGACLWAGDSRLYRFRNNELQQLSRDHSHVEELIQQGFLNREDASSHPEANVITRAVGASEDVFVSINVFNTQIGDTYLLCSDGLYNSVCEGEIIDYLIDENIDKCSQNLLELSLQNEAKDNVSIIVIRGEPKKITTENKTEQEKSNE